jgi:hypothetical protein
MIAEWLPTNWTTGLQYLLVAAFWPAQPVCHIVSPRWMQPKGELHRSSAKQTFIIAWPHLATLSFGALVCMLRWRPHELFVFGVRVRTWMWRIRVVTQCATRTSSLRLLHGYISWRRSAQRERFRRWSLCSYMRTSSTKTRVGEGCIPDLWKKWKIFDTLHTQLRGTSWSHFMQIWNRTVKLSLCLIN